MTYPLDQSIRDLTERRHTNQTGWGLYAREDVAARKRIISIERPMVISLDIPRLKDTCYSCLNYKDGQEGATHPLSSQDARKLQICTGCHVVRYCSKGCQAYSWRTVHKHECDIFARLHPNILPNNVRAIIQLLLLRKVGKLPRGEWDSFMQLESHLQEFEVAGGQTWENICLMARGAEEYSGTDVDEATLRQIFCKLLVNCFTVVGPCYDPLGLVLHPLPCLINHSCAYNATVRFDERWQGHQMSIVALRPIAKDEQVLVSYIDSTNPKHVRQKELQDRYFFTCQCPVCIDALPKRESLIFPPYTNNHLAIEKRAFELLASARKDTSITGPVHKLQYGIHILKKTNSWPLHRQPLASLRQELITSLIAAQQYHLAFLHAWIQYRHIDPKLYPEKHHPLRLVHQYLVVGLIKYINFSAIIQQKDLPPQKFNLFVHAPGDVRPTVDFRIIFDHVLYNLHQRMKNEDSGDWLSLATRVSNMHRGHFNASTVARQHSRASWVEFQEEAEKLREFTKEVLEQELVWGDDGNSE